MNDILFSESQQFRAGLLWLGFSLIVVIASSTAVFALVRARVSFQRFSSAHLVLVLMGVLFGIGALILYTARLDTQVRRDGLYVRFSPFQRSFRRFEWKQVTGVRVEHVNPISDYGGYGIRSGAKGKAYLVSGDSCVMLTLQAGKPVCIGSQHPEELARTVAAARQATEMR